MPLSLVGWLVIAQDYLIAGTSLACIVLGLAVHQDTLSRSVWVGLYEGKLRFRLLHC